MKNEICLIIKKHKTMKKRFTRVLVLAVALMASSSLWAQVRETTTYDDGSYYTGERDAKGRRHGNGLMVFAKTPAAQAFLQQQFERREVSKAYLARVVADDGMAVGRPLAVGDRGKISLPLAPDWYDRPRQQVDPEHGKPAVTEYEVLQVLPEGEALLRLIPHTGRTHQLRVHCAHTAGLGRPIVGDRLYGGLPAERLMLHASYLSFRHPGDNRRLTFTSEPQNKFAYQKKSLSL